MPLRTLLHNAVEQAWGKEAEYEPEAFYLLHVRIVESAEQSADCRAGAIDVCHDLPRQDKLLAIRSGGLMPVPMLMPVPVLMSVPVLMPVPMRMPVLVLAVAAVRGVAVVMTLLWHCLKHVNPRNWLV